MAERDDPDFDAIYTSIDDDYEEYVECANAPTPYLVPSNKPPGSSIRRPKPSGLHAMKRPADPPSFVLTKPPNKSPPLPSKAPPTLKPQKESYHYHGKSRPKIRAGTPANRMAETPLELGTMGKRNHPPEHLPISNPGPNIRGTLHPNSSGQTLAPPQRLTGQKYKALSSDAETNEYASLKPLRKFKTDKLKEKLRIKRNRREKKDKVQLLQEMQDSNSEDIYGDEDPISLSKESISSDNSRVVCLLLSIIVVCLLLSIASLIIAVYTIASFEHYKAGVTPHTRVVEECNSTVVKGEGVNNYITVDCHPSDLINDGILSMQQDQERTEESEERTWQLPHSCKAKVGREDSRHNNSITASLIEDEQGKTYCRCTFDPKSIPPNKPVTFFCTVIETTFGDAKSTS